MKIIKDIGEFRLRTGPLMDLDFALLDIVPSTRLGFFFPSRLSELLVYCQNNPEYHIISFLKEAPIKVNTVVETAAFYMLAQGDRDPELMCVPMVDEGDLHELRIIEFYAD